MRRILILAIAVIAVAAVVIHVANDIRRNSVPTSPDAAYEQAYKLGKSHACAELEDLLASPRTQERNQRERSLDFATRLSNVPPQWTSDYMEGYNDGTISANAELLFGGNPCSWFKSFLGGY